MKGNLFILTASILCILDITPKSSSLPFVSLHDGRVGVDILGFHAQAGINGAGFHVEAKTPFGQKAGAGFGALLNDDGSISGRLYAGATAGGNVKGVVGLGGSLGEGKTIGGVFSSASLGNANLGKSYVGGLSEGTPFQTIEDINKKFETQPILIKNKDIGSNFLSSFFLNKNNTTSNTHGNSTQGNKSPFGDIFGFEK